MLGEHGRAIPMAAADKLLVTETSGKQQAINLLIASIPPPKKPSPKPSIPPVFATYPANGLDKETSEEMRAAIEAARKQLGSKFRGLIIEHVRNSSSVRVFISCK